MSQVKKFQSGGSLTIDGKRYEATPELIQALSSHLKSYGDTAAPLAGLTTALMNGQDVVYDSIGNTITGMNGNWTGIDDRADAKRNVGASRWRKGLQAAFNTDAHQFRNALRYLSGFTYNDKPAETPTSNLTDIYGNQLWYEWTDDEKGNKVLVKDAAANRGITSRIAALSDYLNMSDEAAAKKYKLGSWYDAQRMQALRDLYKAHPTDWQATIDRIAANAAKGPDALTAEDKAFLKHFNIGEGASSASDSGSASTKLSAADRTKWTNAGHSALIDLLGGHAHLNDDGSISLNDGEDWSSYIGNYANGNIWFNNDFYRSEGADGRLNPFKGYTYYVGSDGVGRLYGQDNATLGNILNTDNGFNQLVKSGRFDDANKLIRYRFSKGALENPEAVNDTTYSSFFQNNPNYRFSNLTGLATVEGMKDTDQLVQYINTAEDAKEGQYRVFPYRYRILDEWGNDVTEARREGSPEITFEDLQEIANGTQRDFTAHKRVPKSNPNKNYNNRYYEDILDANNGETGFRFYYDINNPNEDVILQMPEIRAAGVEGQDIRLPKEIAQTLNESIKRAKAEGINSWLDNIIGNPQNQKDFVQWLSSLAQSRYRRNSHGFWGYGIGERRQLLKMGFSEEEVEKLQNALRTAMKGNRAERRSRYLVLAPQLKHGGVIKNQFGGFAGGSKQSVGVSQKNVSTKGTNYKNAAGIGDSQNWTDADTADIIALVADLGSLATAFVPGANLASVGTGAAGSTARFYADRQRGTKGAGLNYLLNLGMDATMAIPILGGMGKIAKIPERIAKAMPTILKAASVYGIGSGTINTLQKIASGEKFTVRDLDSVVNTLTAAIGLGKSGGFGKSKEEMAIKNVAIKGNNSIEGTKSFTLKGSDLEKIETPKALKELVAKEAKVAGDNAVTVENVAERYDLSKFITERSKLNPKTWFNKNNKERFEKPKKEATGGIKEAKTEFGRQVRQYQKEYNDQLRGVPPMQQEIVMPENTQQGLMELNVPAVIRQVGFKRKGIALPQLIYPFTDANNQRNQWEQPSDVVMRPLYKKGGRIVKGATGFPTLDLFKPGQINYSVDLINPQKTNYQSFSTPITESFNSNLNQTIQDNNTKLSGIKLGNLLRGEDTLDNRLALNTILNNISSNPFSNKPKTKANNGDEQGGLNENLPLLDLNVPLNWLRAAHSMAQSDKQLQNFLSRPRYYMHAPLLNAPRFIDSGQKAAYDAAANRTRMYKPVTSDATRNDAAIRQRQAEATNLEIQGNLAHSQEVGKYHAALDEFNNQNMIRNTEIANQNRHLDWQHDIEDVQAKNANIAEKSKFFDQAAYATQDWYNRQLGLAQQKRAREAGLTDMTQLQTWYNNEISNWKTTWAGKEDTAAAQAALTSINNQLQLKKMSMPDFLAEQQLVMPFMKNGGKASRVTYSKDLYPELLLQNSKNSDRFVEKLNDSVIRLILQSKPIHVH